MKIKFDIKELVKGQKKAQERCLELIGKGTSCRKLSTGKYLYSSYQ